MITGIIEARKKRRRLSDARQFLRETERMLKRADRELSDTVREQIATKQTMMRSALDRSDLPYVAKSARALVVLAHKHLSLYRKSSFREYDESIGFANLVALTLRAFVMEAFKIPT